MAGIPSWMAAPCSESCLRPLWSRKYPVNEKNQIELRSDPIFLQVNGKNILIESGLGKGKLTDKQKRNYGVTEESKIG